MTFNSTSSTSSSKTKKNEMRPRQSSLNFIRQMARACSQVSRFNNPVMIVN